MENLATLPKNIDRHWNMIAPLLVIRNEDDYDRAVQRLNHLLDEVGTDENHPLYNLLDTLGTLIEAYEEEHHTIANVSGVEVLAHLIEEHGLSVRDLPEIATPEEIEAILNYEQSLNLSQIKQLSDRFNIDGGAFLD